MTSIYLKPTAAAFCLKQNCQNLTSIGYAKNISERIYHILIYLNSTRCCKCIAVDDICNIMHFIGEQTDVVETLVDKESDTEERELTSNKITR